MVKRFDHSPTGSVETDLHGEFVLASDYDAALARIAALETERQAWIGQAEQGVMVEHDCPAMFACASIIADAHGDE